MKAVLFDNCATTDHTSPGGLYEDDPRVLDLGAHARAESTESVRIRMRETSPAERLTFPVKEGSVKTTEQGVIEEGTDNVARNPGPLVDMLAQTPHDVVYREAAHNTGGAATSERTGPKQDVQDKGIVQGENHKTPKKQLMRTHKTPKKQLMRTHQTPKKRKNSSQGCYDTPPVPSNGIAPTNLITHNEGRPMLASGGMSEGAGGNSCARYGHCSVMTADYRAGGNSSKGSKHHVNALRFISFGKDDENIKTITKHGSFRPQPFKPSIIVLPRFACAFFVD